MVGEASEGDPDDDDCRRGLGDRAERSVMLLKMYVGYWRKSSMSECREIAVRRYLNDKVAITCCISW
ncbi:hypothetical protein N8612_06865 [Verrucomicrobia bacterium]|jgi:hypothetical protein|nr:hypothetical protein [Verrucomicrobiota bacterium]